MVSSWCSREVWNVRELVGVDSYNLMLTSPSSESLLRRALFEDTGGMYPELITRPDIKVFLPPIGGLTVYICEPLLLEAMFTALVVDPCSKLVHRSICATNPRS